MIQKSASTTTSGVPPILLTLLDLVQDGDDDLSSEASLALKFFFERECISGGADWLTNVEAFLTFKENLAVAAGAKSIKELRVWQEARDTLAHEVFRRIEGEVTNAWRHAYILKQAACVPGLEENAAEYLRSHWKKDEVVSLYLLYVIWGLEESLHYDATLKDISENALSPDLRDQATQSLRVRKEIEVWRAQNPDG